MSCNKCSRNLEIVNKHFKLCLICNQERLSSNKKNSATINRLPHGVKSIKKVQGNITADEDFYLQCFNTSNHLCEECDKPLPTEFRDENGKVIARWRYSHILPKSIFPELRHDISNINHLCMIHHTQWDHGDKVNMKIYELNKIRFPDFLK